MKNNAPTMLSLAILLMGVLAIPVGTATFAESDDDLEDIIEDAFETEHESETEELEIEVEIEDGIAKIEVDSDDEELEFEIKWADEQTTIEEISAKTGISVEEIEQVITFEFDDKDDEVDDKDDEEIEDFEDCVESGFAVMESYPEKCMTDNGRVFVNDDKKDYDKKAIHEKLDGYCEMSDQEREEFLEEHDDASEHQEKMNAYCEMSDEEQDKYLDKHKYRYDDKHSIHSMLLRYCEMTEEEQKKFLDGHPKYAEHQERMENFCQMSADERMQYLNEKMMHKDKYHKTDYGDKLDRYCNLSEEELREKISQHHDNVDEHLAKILEYCSLSEDERKEFIKEHHDEMKQKHHDKLKEKHGDLRVEHRVDMMEKMNISDHHKEKLRMKFEMTHSDMSDQERHDMKMEIKEKFHDYRAQYEQRFQMLPEDRKQMILDRLDLMRENSDMRWFVAPLHQMMAGVSIGDIECRDGHVLVQKINSGLPVCLNETTAEKLIERKVVALT